MKKTDKSYVSEDVESYEGTVPLWLIIVFITLFIWGIYYLIEYWGG